ncbi:hypothetical protein BDY24DRAFT_440904 [Mrakia frigida]|uniref:uncharacterized protein n=1 Tax=Mrakia frigida TaxID=29902 RepID=UPI003FCC1AAA
MTEEVRERFTGRVYGNPRRKAAPTLYLAVLFVLGGAVLMTLDTFSTPFIKSIFFLQNNKPLGGNAKFGVFGWCVSDYCIPRQLGYSWIGAIPAGGKLTTALVLFPIASAFSILALISLLLTISTLNLAIWLAAKEAFKNSGLPNAAFGPAFWMAIAAAASLALGCILIFLGGLRALRRGTSIEVVGGYQATPTFVAPPAIVISEGDAGKSKSSFTSKLRWK